jgi:membrane-associated protease RseP (regulator of RpoE activity)
MNGKRLLSTLLLFPGACWLQSCALGDCSPVDETKDAMRSIEVPASHAAAFTFPPELELAEGEVIQRQTYSIGKGKFKLHRSVQKEVGDLGAEFAPLDSASAKRLDVAPYSGALVTTVEEGGPAERAGLEVDDIVSSFTGKPVASPEQLSFLVAEAEPWQPADLKVKRGAETLQVVVEVGRREQMASTKVLERDLVQVDDRPRSGLKVAAIPDDIRPLILGPERPERGLLVTSVLPGGPAFHSDIRLLDVVVAVGGRPVPDTQAFRRELDGVPAGGKASFTVLREGQTLEKEVDLARDATRSSGFNILGLIKQESRPEKSEFEMIWGLLVDAETCHSIKEKDDVLEYRTERTWGAILDLFQWRETPHRTEVRLLWLFPISFRSG